MNLRTRTPLALLLLTTLVLASCTGGRDTGDDGSEDPDPGAEVDASQVTWEPCPEVVEEYYGDIAPPQFIEQITERVSYECGTVTVPQDWDAPDQSGTFEIALVRARSADQSDRIGSLLVNPGGPGASGIETAVYLAFGAEVGGLPGDVLSRFDLVGFDPRGVGKSSPVECFTDEDLDESFGAEPDPEEPAEFEEQLDNNREMAAACGDKYGELLAHYSTRQTAHDLDALREAVGDDQLSYLGFSYGSLLGAVYAQLYPENIRALVLDGAVDPSQDSLAASEEQAQGFERALDNFSDWCAQTPAQCPLEPDARTAIEAAIEDAGSSPVTGEDGREATAGWVFWAVVSSLYSQDTWEVLAAAIDQLDGGDPQGVFDLADQYAQRDQDGNYTNMFDANNAINCADDDVEVTEEQVRDLQDQWREEYPVFGAPLAVSMLGCSVWPAESDPYPTGPAEGAPPILVIGTTGDPATPYESTARLAEMLGTGVVLTWEGEGHTAYPGTSCIDDAVNAYLIDLTVPEDGATCPPE